jgi:hypothetical protein
MTPGTEDYFEYTRIPPALPRFVVDVTEVLLPSRPVIVDYPANSVCAEFP